MKPAKNNQDFFRNRNIFMSLSFERKFRELLSPASLMFSLPSHILGYRSTLPLLLQQQQSVLSCDLAEKEKAVLRFMTSLFSDRESVW